MPSPRQPPGPLSPHDLELGRLAIAWGWVGQAAAAEVHRRGPDSVPLAQRFVAAGLLRPEQVQALEAALARAQAAPSGWGAVPAPSPEPDPSAATAYSPPPAPTVDDPDAATVFSPPPGLQDPTAHHPGPAAFDANGATVLQPPPAARAHPSDSQRLRESSAGGLPQVGEWIEGGYRVEALLGQGGMGAVYRASDAAGKPVALKFILPGKDPSGVMGLRFQREAEAMARIGKVPGVVPVHRAGTHAGCPYLAMGLIEGRDLMQRVKADGALPIEEALELMAKVAEALHGCHTRDVLHRDLKPANVLLRAEDGEPFVTDFGLALIDGDSAPVDRLTKTGELMGTPAFMPPEQADGDKQAIGPRTDVYSLGALLFYLVCGRSPFEGTQLQILHQLFKKEPPPLAQARGRPVPPDLQAIVSKAMAKDPQSRYSDAEALARDLRRLREGEPIEARAPGRVERWRWRLRQRDPRAIGALLLGLTLLVGLAVPPVSHVLRALSGPSTEALFEAWVEALPAELDACAAPPAAEAKDGAHAEPFDWRRLAGEAPHAAELLSKVLPDTASPEPAPLRERLARLQDLLDAALADAPAEARATRALTTARRALPVYRLSLELQDVDWTARSLAQGWSFAEPQHPAAVVLAATALLAYRAPAAATPQGLERRYPDAVAALERLAAQEGPWARAAGRALEQTREVDGAIERALPRVFDMHPGDPVSPPSDLPQGWELLARLRWRALGAEAVEGQLDELLAGDFLDLMRRSETLWRVHEVLVEDQELALDPTLVQAASERVVSFVNERAAEELSRPEAQDLLGEFALAYGQSWGRRAGARVSWRVINAIRAWQAGLLVNREEIALDVLLASIRLGYGYGKALDHVAKDYLQRFEHAPPDQRSGDFFLLWGMLAELLRGEEDADGEPFRDGLAREIDYHRGVAELYAAALGESLSPAERARLDVPAAVSFKAPLSPIWVTHASREVYRHTLRVALKLYRRALQSGDADTASANLGRAVWILERFVDTVLTQGEELSDPPNQVRYTSRAIREMRDVAHDLPPHHGLRSWYRWRFFLLSDRVQPVLEHLVGRLADRTETAESTEDFWSASSTSPAVTRLVHNLAREECGFLNERGWDEEALRRAQARLQQLSAAFPGEHPYALSGLAWEQALRVEQRETARQIAEAALAAALPSDADHVDDALGWRDQLHGWFAELARSEGDLAAAREHLDAALAAGRAEPAHWPPELLAALGTSRAEVDARLRGRE